MAKILLVVDDYQETVTLEALLRKLGFDATGISNELSLTEQLLSFNPDLVMAYGKGKKVSSLSVGRRLAQAKSFTGKVILVFPKNGKPKPQELTSLRMDALLEGPIDEQRLIVVLAGLCGISLNQLNSKLDRKFEKEKENSFLVTGKEPRRGKASKDYTELFKFEALPPRTLNNRAEIRKKWNEARPNVAESVEEDLLEQKRAFVRALFKPKK